MKHNVFLGEGFKQNERVRVIWEGGYIVAETSNEYADFEHFGRNSSVLQRSNMRLTVENPDMVWIESLAPDAVRKRAMSGSVNPDATLLQEKLDKAEAENARLRDQIKKIRVGYDASQTLWKKRYQQQARLVHSAVENLPKAISDGPPEADPNDFWD